MTNVHSVGCRSTAHITQTLYWYGQREIPQDSALESRTEDEAHTWLSNSIALHAKGICVQVTTKLPSLRSVRRAARSSKYQELRRTRRPNRRLNRLRRPMMLIGSSKTRRCQAATRVVKRQSSVRCVMKQSTPLQFVVVIVVSRWESQFRRIADPRMGAPTVPT